MIEATNEVELAAAIQATDKPVLLYFTAVWCGPCKVMRPLIEAQDPDKVTVIKIDADKSDKALLQKYEVKGIPCFILLKDGQPIATRVGLQAKAAFESFLALGYKGQAS